MSAWRNPLLLESRMDWEEALVDAEKKGICALEVFSTVPSVFGPDRLALIVPGCEKHMAGIADRGRAAYDGLVRLMANPAIKKVLYDARTCLSWIWKGGRRPRFANLFDILLASQICQAGFPDYAPSSSPLKPWKKKPLDHSIEALADRHLGIDLYEDIMVKDRKSEAKSCLSLDMIAKAEGRADLLLPLHAIFQELLAANGLLGIAELEFKTLGPIVEMEASGILMDRARARDAIGKREANLVRAVLDMQAEARQKGYLPPSGKKARRRFLYPYIDPDDSEEVKGYLRYVGHDVTSTKGDVLRDLAGKGVIFADRLLTYRRSSSQLSFLNRWLAAADALDGRVSPRYPQASSSTGRISSRDPSAHQVPRRGDGAGEIRLLLQAAPKKVLVKADFSSIEMRIVAFLSGDSTLIKAFQDCIDVHKLTASHIRGISLDLVTPEERDAAKGINFLLIYGGSAKTLQERLYYDYGQIMSQDEAEEVQNKFFDAYSGVRDWQKMQRMALGYPRQHYFHACVSGMFALPLTCTFTALGRRRVWPRFGHGLRASRFQMYNTPCQGTGADLLKLTLCEIYNRLESPDARIICSIHDEIILEVPEEDGWEYAAMLSEIMARVGSDLLYPVPVKAKVEVLASWGG